MLVVPCLSGPDHPEHSPPFPYGAGASLLIGLLCFGVALMLFVKQTASPSVDAPVESSS